MPAHEHRLRVAGGTGTKRRSAGKKSTPLGIDIAVTLRNVQGAPFDLTYWDVWFALVAQKDFDGDLGRLAAHMKKEGKSCLVDRDSLERKLSHLRDLEKRLVETGVSVSDAVSAAGDVVKSGTRRARGNVLERSLRQREWSEAMRRPPRERRYAHALCGHWPRFPVSPEPYADKMRSRFRTTGFYTENQSFKVSDRLDRLACRADRLLTSERYAEAMALLRAWLTVVIQVIEMADDSCGCIGDSFDLGFRAYLKIPLEKTGIEDAVFFPDLLDFLIWEDYGLTDSGIDGYFRRPTQQQGELCIDHLRRQIGELQADDLDYQSEEALTLLGQVVAEQGRYEYFTDLAREMGTREWRRIIRLADRAMRRRKRNLAMEVFEAALTPGPHFDFLTKKCEQLKRGKWNPDPRK